MEELTAHWKPEPMNLPSDSEVRVPPGNVASDKCVKLDTALCQKPFGQDLPAGAKEAVVDLLCWLFILDHSMSSHAVLDWLEAPSWDTLHPLTGRYIDISAQAPPPNAAEDLDAAARL